MPLVISTVNKQSFSRSHFVETLDFVDSPISVQVSQTNKRLSIEDTFGLVIVAEASRMKETGG